MPCELNEIFSGQILSAPPRNRGRAILLAEVKESFLMAMTALTLHKLRSALTLVGVLIGVFSIMVVMTAIRVMQRNIETELSQLGALSFVIQKEPEIFVGGRDCWEKYWHRKNVRYEQALALKEKATLAEAVAVETYLWRGEAQSRYAHTTPSVGLLGVSPESFAAKNWVVEEGRAILPTDIESARNVCVLGNGLARKLFPHGSALKDKIKFEGINYTVIGVLEAKGRVMGGDQDVFVAIPITTGLNRYSHERSITTQVRSAGAMPLVNPMGQIRGLMRTCRKVTPCDS